MKQKIFNKETLAEAVQTLQPVTPTDEEHPAHWYNEGFGGRIFAAQNNWIYTFKKLVINCESKQEINQLFERKGSYPDWPLMDNTTNNQKAWEEINWDFWTLGFGAKIRGQWSAMIERFCTSVNSLR